MGKLFFRHALLPQGWQRNVLIEYDDRGIISGVSDNSPTPYNGIDGDIAVPGMANLHSHAFQRAMAGLTEWRGMNDATDNFWSWREVMYNFVTRLRPEDVQAISAFAYMEMLESGFTAVGEFHYLHHQPDGSAYDNLCEMAERIMSAANETGIGLTLMPVLYAHSGFGGADIENKQRRFYNDKDRFLQLMEGCRTTAAADNRVIVGIAPHSLRAVTPVELNEIVAANPDCPIHIHIAEQLQEVNDCISWSGARPVQWLLDSFTLDERWCLVHATHMEKSEYEKLAKSGATVGLCPITEANLGDGIFAGMGYHKAGGGWGIGSDSNIRIDMAEELRSYEYSQRLSKHTRNVISQNGQATGAALFTAAAMGGAKALGQKMGEIAVGNHCDIATLDSNHPALIGRSGGDWLNSWIFAGDSSCVRDVWVSGKKVVSEGRHKNRAAIISNFSKTCSALE